MRRLEENPLRILDSKDEADQNILKQAPATKEHLNEASREHFEKLQSHLKSLKIPFQIAPHLVRGFDYYSHLVFEFQAHELGAQNAVLAGGRYHHLMKNFGLPDRSGIGWAAGVERLALLLRLGSTKPPSKPRLGVICVSPLAEDMALKWIHQLREQGLQVVFNYTGTLSKQLKKLDGQGVSQTLFFGDDEVQSKQATLKDMKSGSSQGVNLDEVMRHLK